MDYYNEWDKHAAQWIRNLIDAKHLPPGVVDERSIAEVDPSDLDGFTQCHFFAGIAGWKLALKMAGWPDDREVWTGSCPCQPFSAAGKRAGTDDERHLWPEFNRLIAQRRPAIVFGEQVAGAAVGEWIDLVQTDVEALDYAFGALAMPACSVGAPHIRARTWWVADASHDGLQGRLSGRQDSQRETLDGPAGCDGAVEWLGHAYGIGAGRDGRSVCGEGNNENRQQCADDAFPSSRIGRLANAAEQRWQGDTGADGRVRQGPIIAEPDRVPPDQRPGPTNGFWRHADWLYCRDGKWRPVEPGTFPLAHGVSNRVGRLRAYGNAIPPHVAAQWIGAVMECRP